MGGERLNRELTKGTRDFPSERVGVEESGRRVVVGLEWWQQRGARRGEWTGTEGVRRGVPCASGLTSGRNVGAALAIGSNGHPRRSRAAGGDPPRARGTARGRGGLPPASEIGRAHV